MSEWVNAVREFQKRNRRFSGDVQAGQGRTRRGDFASSRGAREPSNRLAMPGRGEEFSADANMPENEGREDRLEGRNAILEAFRAERQIDKLWVLQQEEGARPDPTLARILRYARENGVVVQPTSRAALDRMSCTHAHQGVIAQAAVLPYVEIEDIVQAAYDKGEDPFLILLDEIQDAHNLGAVFRIAEAAGVHGIVLPKRRQVSLDAVTAKVSAGAVNYVPCARVTNLVQAIDKLKQAGVWVAGTVLDGEDIFANKKLLGPIALVVGNEGKGISTLVQKNCDFLVTIPMLGTLNSLNAAVATGISVFEIVRQRRSHKK